MSVLDRVARLVPGLWAGALLCIAFIATPAPFAALAAADAGRVVARVFASEAGLSLVLGMAVVLWERRHAAGPDGAARLSVPMMLALGAVFCTVAGYFGLQPLMQAARAGQGAWSFGQLHAVSLALFGLKTLLVLALAWRASAADPVSPAGPSS